MAARQLPRRFVFGVETRAIMEFELLNPPNECSFDVTHLEHTSKRQTARERSRSNVTRPCHKILINFPSSVFWRERWHAGKKKQNLLWMELRKKTFFHLFSFISHLISWMNGKAEINCCRLMMDIQRFRMWNWITRDFGVCKIPYSFTCIWMGF